jgi:superfamily I DNA and/or RNA helicase
MHVEGDSEDKWSEQEGFKVIELLKQLKNSGVTPDIYIVTPFLIVAQNLRKLIGASGVLDSWTNNAKAWTEERIGTVHTVQGREAEAVIFVLGAPTMNQKGARNWAGSRPNLLNVAITRAKEALYVVGNQDLWRSAGVFQKLAEGLPCE